MRIKILLLTLLLSFNMKAQTVVDIVVNSPVHNTLEAAVGAAGLIPTLSSKGPFTVFAPTDDAFNALPAGTIQALLADPQGALTDVLTYHVLDSKTSSGALKNGSTVTINGKSVKISRVGNTLFINNSKITVKDIKATNGIVHVIDAVLIPPTTVADIIANSAVHNTLEAAIDAAGLTSTLSGPGDFTVFAPTDAAFNALPAGTIPALLADPKGNLAKILKYHVLSNSRSASSLMNNEFIQTINGKAVVVKKENGNVFIDNAKVTVANISTENGIVHVIDAVMLPPTTVLDIIVKSPIHNTLESLAGSTHLVNALSSKGQYTIFAPTDAAFNALPEEVLKQLLAGTKEDLGAVISYHALTTRLSSHTLRDDKFYNTLNGKSIGVNIDKGDIFINNAKIIVKDLIADNGIIHVIDAVMIPPKSVADIIIASPVHKTLTAAVSAANLVGPLSSPTGNFTVFAPTDKAFKAIPAATLQALLADPSGLLTQILTYHVGVGKYNSAHFQNGQYVTTLNGKSALITIANGSILIDGKRLSVTNLLADNGIVHVIDAVLSPSKTVASIVVNSPVHNTLEKAVIAAELVGTLSSPGKFTVFAPTDKAFNAIPAATLNALLKDPKGTLTNILLYHVVGGEAKANSLKNGQFIKTVNGKSVSISISGSSVMIDNAKLTVTDLIADNGVVHIIDAVMLPPTSVVDVIAKSPTHNTLETAIKVAGLTNTLKGAGPFTIFAPTDEAFAQIPTDVLNALIANPSELAKILTYHAVAGKALSTDLSNGQTVSTINGKPVSISIDGNTIKINNSVVIFKDIIADNGIVHVIDAVLLPPTNIVENIVSNRSKKNNTTISIYPNPFVNDLNIDFSNSSSENAKCIIYDQVGRVIYEATVEPISTINLQSAKGTLFIKLSNKDFDSTYKVFGLQE